MNSPMADEAYEGILGQALEYAVMRYFGGEPVAIPVEQIQRFKAMVEGHTMPVYRFTMSLDTYHRLRRAGLPRWYRRI